MDNETKPGMFAPDDPNDTMFQMPTSPLDNKEFRSMRGPTEVTAQSQDDLHFILSNSTSLPDTAKINVFKSHR